jgi:hypothetical protein
MENIEALDEMRRGGGLALEARGSGFRLDICQTGAGKKKRKKKKGIVPCQLIRDATPFPEYQAGKLGWQVFPTTKANTAD